MKSYQDRSTQALNKTLEERQENEKKLHDHKINNSDYQGGS